MNLTPAEQNELDNISKPRTRTLTSVGQFVIELTVRIDSDGSVLSLGDVNPGALSAQLRELADNLDPDDPEPFDGEIRYVKGTDQLDEIVLDNVDVHIEQMSESCYWMSFRGRGTDAHKRLTVNIAPAAHVKRNVPLNGYVDENDLGVKETR